VTAPPVSPLRLLVSRRWLLRHLMLVAAVTVCWLFGRWQLGRALHRHSILNWSYTIEWTLFAAFAVLTWGWFLRDELRGKPHGHGEEAEPLPEPQPPAVPPVTDDEDPELAAYNRMLAELHRKATS
jgi:hypothetical protein